MTMARIGILVLLCVSLTASLLPSGATAHTPFKYRSYDQMAAYLEELAQQYPEVLRLSVAQETYKLPYPKELVCGKNGEPCKHFVVHLTNHSTLPDVNRPEVFISGALHGNERVGPITTVELITLMAKYATQYARGERGDAQTAATRQWLHELVNTRSVILTPMTNAYGYAHNTREELGVDPNRDYNYMRAPRDCMVTMTSRVVNELWRDHIFQLAITFHGGMRAVSYEWGSPDHYLRHNSQRSEKSPDHTAQFQLANVLARFAGAFADGTLYPTGTMNDVVYGVSGGMEDWGYAASWENALEPEGASKPFAPCEPTTFGGYPSEKTRYNNVTHRAFNMLIETSFNKEPTEATLGAFEDVYATELDFFAATPGFKAGHVTQNVRLALMMIEMVQPYVRWVDAAPVVPIAASGVDALPLDTFRPASLYVSSDDELTEMGCGGFATETGPIASCSATACSVQRVNGTAAKLQLAWEVLGAFTVDKTHVEVSTSADFDPKHIVHTSAVQSGTTRRAIAFAEDAEDVKNADTLGTSLFVACLDLKASYGAQLFARVVATVDQDWATQGAGDDAPSPHIPPQSHVVNARTNPAWHAEWNGHRVVASLDWYSPVITVTVVDAAAVNASAAPTTSKAAATTTLTPTLTASTHSKLTPSPKLSAAVAAGVAKSSWGDDDEIDDIVVSEPEHSEAPAATTNVPDESGDSDDVSDDDDEATDGNDSVSLVPNRSPVVTTVAPTTSPSPATATSVSPAATVAAAKNAALSANEELTVKEPSSLRSFGLLVISSGGFVILVTLAILYKRVFRSKRKHYMNISGERPPHASAAIRTNGNTDGDDEEDEDDA